MKNILVAALLSVFAVSANAQQSDNVVTATYGNATGNTTRTMTVALNHANDYVAFYLTLTLPEGTTVTGVSVKSPLKNGGTVDLSHAGGSATESTDFNVPFKQIGTKCNFVGYNYGDVKIVGESGEILFTINLETTEGVAFDEGNVECNYEFAGLLGPSLTGTVTTDSRLWSDVNSDKAVSLTDINQANNVYLNKSTKSSLVDSFAGDFDSNEQITISDINKINNIYLNK